MNTRRAGSGRYRPSRSSLASSSSSRSTPYSFDLVQGGAVDTRCAVVACAPRPTPATGRLCARPCPTARETVARDRPWPPGTACVAGHAPCPAERTSAVGGTSRIGTHRAPPQSLTRIDEVVALPSPAVMLSARLNRYYGHLRRPPGWLPLPGSSPVIGRRRSNGTHAARRAGEGLSSSRRHYPNVPRPLRRGVLHGCTSRIFTASMAFALPRRARHSLAPPVTGQVD